MKITSKYLARFEEKRLVKAFLARRDEKAFRELYRRFTPALYQLALRLVGWVEQDAEEVVQDVWIRAVEALPDFRWESSFRTWLCGIAVNRCREFYRGKTKQQSERTVDGLDLEAPGTSDAERIDLENAIANLPQGYRAVLVLHDIEGYTHEEIGRLLDIEAGTSKSQLFHARRAVREALQANSPINREKVKNDARKI